MQLFSADAKIFWKKIENVFLPTKNHLKKLHTYGSREFLFSAAPTAQNSPELHFRFINSFIQWSLIRSLIPILFNSWTFLGAKIMLNLQMSEMNGPCVSLEKKKTVPVMVNLIIYSKLGSKNVVIVDREDFICC